MRGGRVIRTAIVAWGLGALGAAALEIAVSTSLLEDAVRRATAGVDDVSVSLMMPAGQCPGHFDMRPSDAAALRSADRIFLHDFQSGLRQRLEEFLPDGARRIAALRAEGSLLIPARYLGLVRGAAEALDLPDDAGRNALEVAGAMADRMDALCREAAAGWRGVRVIASLRQADFCRWLGLDVVGVLPPGENVTPRDIDALAGLGAEAIVGNLQSDAREAEWLARRLTLPVAILSNFPGAPGYGATYEELTAANLDRLEPACAPRP